MMDVKTKILTITHVRERIINLLSTWFCEITKTQCMHVTPTSCNHKSQLHQYSVCTIFPTAQCDNICINDGLRCTVRFVQGLKPPSSYINEELRRAKRIVTIMRSPYERPRLYDDRWCYELLQNAIDAAPVRSYLLQRALTQ